MKQNSLKMKLTKSFVGRVVRRLLGEEKGQAMMEYIVVALLIAAACIIGVAFFGHTITGMFGVLSDYVMGNPNAGAARQTALQTNADDNADAAQAHNTGVHNGANGGDQDWTD